MHWLPGQHGAAVVVVVPGVPQTTHRFELLHTMFAAVQTEPVQHGCPAPPQATHVLVLLLQLVPASRHAPPTDEDEQQAWPIPPHGLHR